MKNYKSAIDKLTNQFNKEIKDYADFIEKNSWPELQISIMKDFDGIHNTSGVTTINVYLPERKRAGWPQETHTYFSFSLNGKIKAVIYNPTRFEGEYIIRSKKKIKFLIIQWIKYRFHEIKRLPKM